MVLRLLGFILQKATRTALSVTEPWPKCKAIILSIYMDTCTAASSTAWALNLIFHTHDAWVFGLGSITVDAYRSDRPRLASSCSLLLVRTRCSEATAASSKSAFLREKEATTDIFQSALCLACFPELPSSKIALWSSKKLQRNCGVRFCTSLVYLGLLQNVQSRAAQHPFRQQFS